MPFVTHHSLRGHSTAASSQSPSSQPTKQTLFSYNESSQQCTAEPKKALGVAVMDSSAQSSLPELYSVLFLAQPPTAAAEAEMSAQSDVFNSGETISEHFSISSLRTKTNWFAPDLAALCEGYLLEMKQFLEFNATPSSPSTSAPRGLTSCENVQGAFLANFMLSESALLPFDDEAAVISAVKTQLSTWCVELCELSNDLREFLSCEGSDGCSPGGRLVHSGGLASPCATESLKRQCWRIQELMHLQRCLSPLLLSPSAEDGSSSSPQHVQRAQHWKDLVDLHEQLGWIFLPSSSRMNMSPSLTDAEASQE